MTVQLYRNEHSEFTDFVAREGYEVRESTNPMNNVRYGRVIEVRVPDGRTGHIEVEVRNSWVPVANGPFFVGGTDYVTCGKRFSLQQDAERALVASLSENPL
jgi:hypothetical protein